MKADTAADHLHFAALRIETHKAGTCFVMKYTLPDGESFLFLVTNKHTVENTATAFVEAPEGTCPEEGLRRSFNFELDTVTSAVGHLDDEIDIVVIPLESTPEMLCRSIPMELLPSARDLEEIRDNEDILLTGYPSGAYNSAPLRPATKKGPAHTPLTEDYEGSPKFLVRTKVSFGDSGSPAFLLKDWETSANRADGSTAQTVLLLGMLTGGECELPVSEDDNGRRSFEFAIIEKASSIVETMERWLRGRNRLPWDDAS